MEQFRLVRTFSNGVTPSTEKAYRVESAHLTSERDALSLLNDLHLSHEGQFRLFQSFGNGTRVSADRSFGVESVRPVSERDGLSVMRELDSPYEGSRYLPNNRVSVFSGTRVSNDDQQQQG
jgi:hypothetical protein